MKDISEMFNLTEEKIKTIREKSEKKIKTFSGKYSNLIENVMAGADWVEKNKIILNSFCTLLESLQTLLDEPLLEAIDRDAFIHKIKDEIYLIDRNFALLSKEFVDFADRRLSPMTMQSKTQLQNEMIDYWARVQIALERTQEKMRSFKGKMMMLGIWESHPELHVFFDRIEKSTYRTMESNLKNGENPLGSEFDSIDELD